MGAFALSFLGSLGETVKESGDIAALRNHRDQQHAAQRHIVCETGERAQSAFSQAQELRTFSSQSKNMAHISTGQNRA